MSGGSPSAVHTIGGLLPRDLLARLAQGDPNLGGTDQASYHVPKHERLGERIDQSWSRLRGLWESFREGADLGPSEHHIGPTRNQWLLPLFESLGYGRLQASSTVKIEGKSFSISHFWGAVPIHLVGAGMSIDRRTPGAPGGAKAAPHSLMQEFLNRSEDSRWAFVSNGLVLRILRDNDALSQQAYVEFDLEAILDGELYADFRLLWLICHQSRVEGERPEDCWLERWFQTAQEDGVRALDDLRDGVEKAIEALGAGFLKHPANKALQERLSSEVGAADQYYRELLRLVYRLIFLFVAEDRDALLDPDAPAEPRERYSRFYHSSRLRAMAGRRRGTSHSDLWTGLRTVLEHLHEGCEPLGLPALGSFLWSPDAMPWVGDQSLRNDDLLLAVRHLCYTEKDGNRFPVNWRTLGAEELGSVYESLLELHPTMNREVGHFELGTAAGSERKTTGSYYTPTSLVDALLDSALEPVLERCMKEVDPEQALLDLKVCDTAAGSGHFLVAAARRIAMRLASVRTGDDEASPEAVTHALRDVVGRCVYGVDLNPLAVELCKVSLWMEALEPGKPLSFLDHHIQAGNSLLGTTSDLLDSGVPDDAFKAVEGDDKSFCRDLRRRNKKERLGQLSMHAGLVSEPQARYGPIEAEAQRMSECSDDTLADVRLKETRWQRLRDAPAYKAERLAADAWCAAFTWRKTAAGPPAITDDTLHRLRRDPKDVPPEILSEINHLATRYGFFHFHLAFPDVFGIDESQETSRKKIIGGFDVLIGNPPWDQLQFDEAEFFAGRHEGIARAKNASERTRLIDNLRTEDPALYRARATTRRDLDATRHFVRNSGLYGAAAAGKINIAHLFLSIALDLVNVRGLVGLVLPTSIATDQAMTPWFKDLWASGQLRSCFDFLNALGLFPDVRPHQHFCLVTCGTPDESASAPDFAFGLKHPRDLAVESNHFRLAVDEIDVISPGIGALPLVSDPRDFPLLLKLYHGSETLGDWDLRYRQGLFNTASDSHLFEAMPESNHEYYPLFDAKMARQYNHRAASLSFSGNVSRRIKSRDSTEQELQDPQFSPAPAYWVERGKVESALGEWNRDWLLGFKDVTGSTSLRLAVACFIPRMAVGHPFPLVQLPLGVREHVACCAILNSLVTEYVLRIKMTGLHLTLGLLNELPAPPLTTLAADLAWLNGDNPMDWLSVRGLELSFTAYDLAGLAKDLNCPSPPFRWDRRRRRLIRDEMDAFLLHLFNLDRPDAEFLLDSLTRIRNREVRKQGEYRTKRLILEIFDSMAEARQTGEPYRTRLDPPPGDPRAAHPPASDTE